LRQSDIESCDIFRPESQTALSGNKKQVAVDTDRMLDLAGARFHFIGAGGVGMSGLALLLMKNKAVVAGSDQMPSEVVDSLRREGADIRIGHKGENLSPETDAVVISAAITEDNLELQQARARGCKVYKYADMLGELMNRYEGIAISGTHGKSTASGWLIHLLKQAGMDPNFIVGAKISQLDCILNIEQDHLDYYKDEDEIVEAFGEFALGTKPGGIVIANGQDANVAKIIRRLGAGLRCETFGLEKNCTLYAENIALNDGLYAFDVYYNNKLLGGTKISLPGKHNILNALAVIAMAINVGLEPERALELLPGFTGIERRLMLKGRFDQITVLDDYAHHPTEIRASLAAIRQKYPSKQIWCIFQPHQYSRTRFLLDDFAESFKLADVTIVPEIYFVRDSESARKEINAQILVDRMQVNGTQALFIESFEAICDYLKNNVGPGELVVTMGAGDIWKVADEYLQWLRANR